MGVASISLAENGLALAKIWASGLRGDLPTAEAWGYVGWTPGNSRERSTAIPHNLFRKEGRNSGELLCAFIYVSNFIKGEGAGSTQAQLCPGSRGLVGHLSLTQQEILGQGTPKKTGYLRLSL